MKKAQACARRHILSSTPLFCTYHLSLQKSCFHTVFRIAQQVLAWRDRTRLGDDDDRRAAVLKEAFFLALYGKAGFLVVYDLSDEQRSDLHLKDVAELLGM